jgi:hypothetical protein
MSEPSVMVQFRLDRDQPLRLRWLADDGAPGNGYKAQITSIALMDGSRLAMQSSAILEQVEPEPGVTNGYVLMFNGMVGYAADHPDRAIVDALVDQEIDYDLELVHDDTGRVAIENIDYRIVERPRGHARRLGPR